MLSENETNNGITQLMADLLTRGATRRSAEQLADEIEQLGASLSGFAGRNSFGLQVSGLSGDADVLLEVMADCLTHSTFPADEVEKQRTIQLAGIRQQRESSRCSWARRRCARRCARTTPTASIPPAPRPAWAP